jgi:hypothetical protein
MTGALQYPRCYSARGYCSREREAEDRWLGLQGELGTPAAGLRPRTAREKVFFLLISCLIRLIHLLSLYREVYLTPKQATN